MNAPSNRESQPRAASTSLRHRLRKLLRPPRLLSLTRAGKFFVLLTLAVGFGAINTGNNLLFLLFGMLLALIVASGVLSEAVIRNLRVRRHLPDTIEAGQSAPGEFRLFNQGWWPSLSIEPSEQNPEATAGPLRGHQIGPQTISWWKFWRQQTDEESRPIAATYCLRAAPQKETTLRTHYKLSHRGQYFLPGLQVKTRFPFGLFEKTRRFDAPAQLLVFPRPAPAQKWLGQLRSHHGEQAQNKRGAGDEFFGLRDYRPGGDQRAIHWKSTARRGEPVVRETEAQSRRSLLIVVDNRAPATFESSAASAGKHDQFEAGLSHLTGLLHRLSRRNYRIHMVTAYGAIEPDQSGQIRPLLKQLARLELQHHSAAGPALDDLSEQAYQSRLYVGFKALLPAGDERTTPLSFDDLSTDDDLPIDGGNR